MRGALAQRGMALLIGKRTAVMSVGISCQAAEQLRSQVDHVAKILGERLEVHTTPWDWTICGPAGVAQMVQDGVTFPRDPSDLEARARPYWPARSCYFWHVGKAIARHQEALEEAQGREAWLDRLAGVRRRVFILANTQNNLEAKRAAVGGFGVGLDRKGVDLLEAALVARWGPAELHVVTRRGLHTLKGRARTWELRPDPSEWRGDRAQWRALLAKILA